MKFKVLDNETLRAAMAALGRESVLVVGNRVEKRPIEPRDSEYVIAFPDNYMFNKIPPARIDLMASPEIVPQERCPGIPQLWTMAYPHGMDNLAACGRWLVYLIDNITMKASYDALGLNWLVMPPTPTTGFATLFALAGLNIPVRVAGFSWYSQPDETRLMKCALTLHFPERERAWCGKLKANPLFSFTDETLSHLTL